VTAQARGRDRAQPGGPRDRGSMALEFVVAAPAFVLLLLLIALGGEWVSATGQVGSAARDAVRAASLDVAYADVAGSARTVAQGDLNHLCPAAAKTSVQLLAGGQQVGPADWAAGAQVVEVKVSCTISFSVFAVLGIPASQTFSDTAAAPLDQFTERTG
jgi:Flp pilus assembly protein TadG